MKVGVLGSGDVAKVLAGGFVRHGHGVMIGSRSPEKLADWARHHPGVATGTFADAARFGELIVLAVKGTAADEALQLAGEAQSGRKDRHRHDKPDRRGAAGQWRAQVLHQPRRITDGAAAEGASRSSLGQSIQFRRQRLMVNPEFKGGKPTMFICGNDEASKATVDGVLEQFGWETADMGKAEAARAIEPLCMLWCIPGFLRNDWIHAFKLLA